jgi:hypothetical protein
VDREAVDGSSLSARLRRGTAGGEVELLILLDQFEEYFLYHPGPDEPFDDEFAAAVNDRELRASFLVSLREDAFAQLDRFKARIPQLLDSYRRVDELDAQAARAAIVRPIDQYNQLLGPGEEPFKVEDRLVELIVDSVASGRLETEAHVGEPPARTVEAAYLQIVLARLWREERAQGSRTMRAETLEQLGGAAQVVRTHLDRALDALPPSSSASPPMPPAISSPPRARRSPKRPGTSPTGSTLPVEDVRAVLDALTTADVRILRLRDDHAYEIFSDVLAPAVRDWRARFESARERELLAERLVQETRASPEASVARLRRQLRLALAVIVLLATALVVVLVAG